MAAAARAMVLGARQYQLPVALGIDIGLYRFEKTGPAGTAVKLGCRGKHGEIAGSADISAIALFIIERARPWTLRARLKQHFVLLRVEQLAPFILSFVDGWEIFAHRCYFRRCEYRFVSGNARCRKQRPGNE